jgi:glycosyltransferase involved in cell wall biosynthesis
MNKYLSQITVNLPTLNEQANIGKCIDKIRRAGIKKIIVVDGGSNDNTKLILKKLKVKFYETYNKGLAFQRNLAIKKTKTKYVAIINADERVKKNTFQIMLKDLKNNEAKCAGVQCQIISSNKKKNYIENAFQTLADINLNKKGLRNMIGSPTLWKTSILKRNNWDPFFTGPSDDTDLCYRLSKKGYFFGSSEAVVENAHRVNFFQYIKKFLWYGKGDAQFIIRHPERLFHILKHQLYNYPLKFSFIAIIKLRSLYLPFFIVIGYSRFFGMFLFLIKNLFRVPEKMYRT